MSLCTIEISKDKFLAINEIGEAKGIPIIVNHGMIASIREDRLFDSLVDAGFRVLSVARPGYGLSTPFEMKNIEEWGNIVEEIIDNKRIENFDVLGMSSGAPYGYAIAHAMPEKIRNTYIFSGTPALCDERVKRLWPYPLNAEATIEELQETAKELFFGNGINEEDMGSVDSAKNGCFGIALDLKIRCQDWGFSLGDIKTKVYMEHGIDDASVPFGTAEITAGLLPNCVMRKRANGGHFSRELLDEFIKETIITTEYKQNAQQPCGRPSSERLTLKDEYALLVKDLANMGTYGYRCHLSERDNRGRAAPQRWQTTWFHS